jgi:hypothetical protein
MAVAPGQVFDYMTSLPVFEADRNIWYQVYPGQEHSMVSWFARMWNALKILSVDRQ